MIIAQKLSLVLVTLEYSYYSTQLVAHTLSANSATALTIVVSSNSDADIWCDLGNYESFGRKFYG